MSEDTGQSPYDYLIKLKLLLHQSTQKSLSPTVLPVLKGVIIDPLTPNIA